MNLPRKRRILYVCDARFGSTASYRAQSLRRLGLDATLFDISGYFYSSKVLNAIAIRVPAGPFIGRINRNLLRAVREHRPDVVFFDRPTQFTKSTILEIRQTGAQTVCYNQDNPFGPRNDPGWHQFYKVFRLFDLHCAIRPTDIARFEEWGFRWVRVMFSFEPSVHFPSPQGWSDTDRSRAVSYIGSPYEERPRFLQQLGEEHHVPITIAGTARWKDHLPAAVFSKYVRDGPLLDSAYREAIWRSKINLSFLTRLNEDDISHKSVEIAACQGFLLAVRCEGHQEIFEEDREAAFFSSVEECADKCRFYLERPELREAIAAQGRARAVRSGYDNDTQLTRILNALDGANVE